MEPIILKCTNCGGELEFEGSMEFGFCKYCGTKVAIPRAAPSQVINVMSDSSKFFLLVYNKGEQTQHAIKDEVTLEIGYRSSAVPGDPAPLSLSITTNGQAIPVKSKLKSEVGIGKMQISGIGRNLSITKDQKVKANINGSEMITNFCKLGYGDLVSLDNVIIRVQPMLSE